MFDINYLVGQVLTFSRFTAAWISTMPVCLCPICAALAPVLITLWLVQTGPGYADQVHSWADPTVNAGIVKPLNHESSTTVASLDHSARGAVSTLPGGASILGTVDSTWHGLRESLQSQGVTYRGSDSGTSVTIARGQIQTTQQVPLSVPSQP
jgi:hypothetical protein